MKKYLIPFGTAIALIAGALAAEDRWLNEKEAVEMEIRLETAASSTFQSIQRGEDRRHLRGLRDTLVIVNSLLKKNPNDTYLQMRRQEIIRQIQRLEGKLNGR